MHDVAAIILAAGTSRRMGKRNKLLLPINGVPMIRHMANIYRKVTDGPISIVTGHEAESVAASFANCDVRCVHNPDFEHGQQTSVACGLHAVARAKQILIGLGDQPLLTHNDLRALLKANRTADPAQISIPLLGGKRGNPIVVPAAMHDQLLADPRSPGCKSFTRDRPEHVQFHALPSQGFYWDVDTPESYAALNREHVP